MQLVDRMDRTGWVGVLTAMALLVAAGAGPGIAAVSAAQTPVLGAASIQAALPAQAPVGAGPAAKTAVKHSTGRKHSRAAIVETVPEVAAPAVPAAPPPPDWPVNDQPMPATVNWNGRNLQVSATNSSLRQILADISTATGVKVEGTTADQRVYGSYGPAPARDVLSQLLDGTGFNVLMIGDRGEGTPRTLVLTAKGNTATSPNTGMNTQIRQNPDEEAQDEPEQPEQPDPNSRRQPGIPALQPGQNRSPQQIMQEMEQRRQQLLQLQQGQPNLPIQQQPVPVQPQE